MTDLDAIAAEEEARLKPERKCWLCSIPEREWVEKAKKEGRALTVIIAVLVRQGHSPELATKHRIKGHCLANPPHGR